ncbi:hypothetical protein [Xanthomonas phage BUDD]|nr:hypothetical protein [Xanthomonas phage BUDD]
MWPFGSRTDARIRALELDLAKKESQLIAALNDHVETLVKYQKGIDAQISLLNVVDKWERSGYDLSPGDRSMVDVVMSDFKTAIAAHCQHKTMVKTDRPDPMFPGDWYHQCSACGKFDYEI